MLLPRTAVALAAIFLCGALASLASACPSAGQQPAQLTPDEGARAVFCLINQRRSHQGLKRLRANPLLRTAALGHSNAMDTHNFFSHSSGVDGSAISRITATGYAQGARSWGVGESINWGVGRPGTPKTTVSRWMNSAGHRAVLLKPRFREIGVGVAIGSPAGSGIGAIYTVDFGFRH